MTTPNRTCTLAARPWTRFRLSVLAAVGLLLAACSSDDGDGTEPPTAVNVTISGNVTYQKVPFNTTTNGLDFAAAFNAPVRGALVEAIDNNDGTTIRATANTDANGNYSLEVGSGRTVFIRIKAQLQRTGSPAWNFQVLNNTNNNALYALDGSPVAVGTTPLTVNLNAISGWNGTGYTTGQRHAAPFSLLDVAYEMMNLVLTANASAVFDPLSIFWSPSNRASDRFDPSTGEIITTSFVFSPPAIYVLGLENADTDEFDQHVIAHELGHYFQSMFSRDDTLGGQHSTSERLDLRVAFSEGWGNAFSGMVKNDPRYRDSFGLAQANGFVIDVEVNGVANPGWFSEGSSQSLLYDFFDAAADGNDAVALGFAPLFQVLNNDFSPLEPHTAIFPFVRALKERNPGSAANIDTLVAAQNIVSATIDDLGTTETNNGGAAANLPVYVPIVVDGPVVQVCSATANGEYNKLGNRKFVRFNVPVARQITMRAQVVGPAGPDPDLALFRRGFIAESDDTGTIEEFTRSLDPGNYVLEVFDFLAVDNDDIGTSGNSCMNVSVISTL